MTTPPKKFKNQPTKSSKEPMREKSLGKRLIKVLIYQLLFSLAMASFPPPGKCSYYILPSAKTFTGVANDPEAIQKGNNCPQSTSSFRVSILAKLTGDVPTSESAILFAYHNIIQVFIKRDGAGHKLEVFKTGEANGGLLFSEPIGKLNWKFLVFLQITPTEAHLALRSWKNYAHEFHRKWKVSFGKFSNLRLSLLISSELF